MSRLLLQNLYPELLGFDEIEVVRLPATQTNPRGEDIMKKTVDLDIPHDPAERVRRQDHYVLRRQFANQWRACCNCGWIFDGTKAATADEKAKHEEAAELHPDGRPEWTATWPPLTNGGR